MIETFREMGLSLLQVVAVYGAVVLYARLNGLRSFSKMSVADFAMTVAVGSVLASAADPSRSLPVVLTGLATLFLCQWGVAKIRIHSRASRKVVDNSPLLLMANGEVLEDNLERSRVTREDLMAKLREANVLHFGQVRAVVMETTGDVSVLHSDDSGERLDLELLAGVRDSERARV